MKVLTNDSEQIITSEIYEVLQKVPKPKKESGLSKSQLKWYYYFAAELLRSRRVTGLDCIHIEKAAIYMDLKSKALIEANAKEGLSGFVQKFPSGATNITGYMTVIKECDKALDDFSAHFGLSIKDRAKLKSTQAADPNQLSLFEKFASQAE